jgi:hypothetical protein
VALRACGETVSIHPYVFRLVCQNGAIMAQAFASRRVRVGIEIEHGVAVDEIRQAIRVCGDAEVFNVSVRDIRAARNARVDLALNILPLLARLRKHGDERIVQEILRRFFDDGDQTRFGFMNAITSVARDTADPQVRWNLEELGGGVPTSARGSNPRKPTGGRALRREPALVS